MGLQNYWNNWVKDRTLWVKWTWRFGERKADGVVVKGSAERRDKDKTHGLGCWEKIKRLVKGE